MEKIRKELKEQLNDESLADYNLDSIQNLNESFLAKSATNFSASLDSANPTTKALEPIVKSNNLSIESKQLINDEPLANLSLDANQFLSKSFNNLTYLIEVDKKIFELIDPIQKETKPMKQKVSDN